MEYLSIMLNERYGIKNMINIKIPKYVSKTPYIKIVTQYNCSSTIGKGIVCKQKIGKQNRNTPEINAGPMNTPT